MISAPAQLQASQVTSLGLERRPIVSPLVGGPWDTELCLLWGEDRGQLCQRARALLELLRANANSSLKDLAFTLALELKPGGERLALVAGSTAELQSRLQRALERLEDPACRQIR